MENLITPTLADELGNAGRLLGSWLDGILEFTILKHEVIVLKLKDQKVMEKIRVISLLWPKKKVFIEGAYKILLFTKVHRRQVNKIISIASNRIPFIFNFEFSQQNVLRSWYE